MRRLGQFDDTRCAGYLRKTWSAYLLYIWVLHRTVVVSNAECMIVCPILSYVWNSAYIV